MQELDENVFLNVVFDFSRSEAASQQPLDYWNRGKKTHKDSLDISFDRNLL